MLTGCNRGKIAEMENELANLRNEKHVADSLQNEFYGFLNEIENNLAEIKAKERIVSQTANEKPQNMQEKILSDLDDISKLMAKNRQRLNELENIRRQLNAANVNTQKLQDMIDALTARVEAQEAEIAELREQLKIANEKIGVLTDENRQISEDNQRKQAKIDEQVIELNTGFYVTGTTQELRTNGVITQKGGFIGIGKTNTINQDAALRNFTKIDIREFKKLETNSDKIELITPHAPESFRINDENKKNLVIEITNPELFWKSSKFLVVRVR
jgi:DNA repair exonuclease SbcCD ATPase subunit